MAWNNLGIVLLESGRTEEAYECFLKASTIHPGNLEALLNLALSCKFMGRAADALTYVEQVLTRRSCYGPALSLWVSLLQQTCEWTRLRTAMRCLEAATRAQLAQGKQPAESPFLSFSRTADSPKNLLVARAWSKTLVRRLAAERQRLDAAIRRRGPHAGPVTIGYLSEQFRNSATAHLTASLFGGHDRSQFQINAYSLGIDDGSSYRRRIEEGVDRFIDIRNLSIFAAAERIRADGVDILVDLIGWMHGHRMGILALRPAPIQVNYLGYPGTSGADFMDYIVADPVIIPSEHQPFYSEKVVYLPHCYQATDPTPPICAEPVSRHECGLPENGFIFASFNTDYKIEPEVFCVWMNILRAVPGAVLWLLVRTNTAQHNLRQEAAALGIDPRRLIFAEAWPKERHLSRLKLADAALDTLTVNGHTTTTDAIWSGVPVVTVQGTHFASRVAASILLSIGMDELITHSMDDYQKLAIRLALEMGLLAAVKTKLSANKKTYPLFDIHRYVRNLESAYLGMWQRYKKGQMPMGFEVKEHPSHPL
jgi:protein O-GlcNAc transferase